MLQAVAAISQHAKLLNRGIDLEELKGHLLRVLNSMVLLIHDLPHGVENVPDTTFLLAGWSWRRNQFKMWLLHYDASIRKFTFRPAGRWRSLNKQKELAFTGDYKSEYKERLIALLRKKSKLQGGGFDMEPLEVLRDMLRDSTFDLIGGAPQVIKVYRYSGCKPFAVFWPNKTAATVNLLGRPLLHYEQADHGVLDVDTMKTSEYQACQKLTQKMTEMG